MASSLTHNEFYKEVYKELPASIQKEFKDTWDQYRILGQGHDLLFFYMFWNLHKMSTIHKQLTIIGNNDVQKFTVNYINWLVENNLYKHESLLFLYGYLIHHFLDAKLHPLIIYETGDFKNDKNANYNHLYLENQIDATILKRIDIDPRSYNMSSIIPSNAVLSKETREIVKNSFSKTYQITNFDKPFINYNNNTKRFLKLIRYDPSGIKKKIFKLLDPILIKTIKPSIFPFVFDGTEAEKNLNLDKKFWTHPVTGKISDKTFFELYDDGKKEISHMITYLHEAIMDKAPDNEIESIVPDISSVTGLSHCEFKIKHIKRKSR